MRRREFIALLGGAATTWPIPALGQKVKRIGILMGSADDAEYGPRVALFLQTLERLGWVDGRTAKIDIRWNDNDQQSVPAQVRDLLQLEPDVIFAGPSRVLFPLQKQTRTVPIVFVQVSDPIGQGIVDNLARPGGNTTGFSNLEFSLIGKWLQILKEAAPKLTRVALMISATNAASPIWYREFKKAAAAVSIEPLGAPVRSAADIERTIAFLSPQSGDGLIVAGDTLVETPSIRRRIVELVAANKLPTLYGVLSFAADGGLICYGIDQADIYRRAATYVDRILRGEKPSDLPVQQPTEFHFTINLKTAKALGLEPSTTLVASADEVIE